MIEDHSTISLLATFAIGNENTKCYRSFTSSLGPDTVVYKEMNTSSDFPSRGSEISWAQQSVWEFLLVF